MNAHYVIAELQAKAGELDFDERWTLAELTNQLADHQPLRQTQERDLKEIADRHGVKAQ